MRYSKSDLLQLRDYHLTFDEDLTFQDDLSDQFPRIRRIKDINVKGDGNYIPQEQRLYIKLTIKGTVVVGCDITLEDVDVPIDTEEDAVYTFDRNETDINVVMANNGYIELLPTIFQTILMEIPTKVVKPGKIEYPKGDGWEVLSEKDYEEQKHRQADPRLAKLMEYNPQDD